MDLNSELRGTPPQGTGRGSHGDTGEDKLNRKRYQAGKRDFWVVAICEILVRVCYLCVTGIKGSEEGPGYVLIAMLLFLSYRAHRWAWHLYCGIVVFNLIQFTASTALIVSEWYWVRYTLAQTALISHVFEFAGILAMGYFMLIKRDVGYFIKRKRMERKKESGGQTEKEGNSKES